MSRNTIHINGKWLSQSFTGTQRYSTEIVKALVEADVRGLVLHIPAGVEVPSWLDGTSVQVRRAPVAGVLFEQVYLPLATFGRLLLNFAGPAPLLKHKQLVTMHDAITFRYPQSYRATFVRFYYVMYYLLGRSARYLVTVSHFSAGELSEVLKVPIARFLVAGCAADSLAHVTPQRPELALDGSFYLAVGTLAHHKNLMEPVAAVAQSGRTVVVVGASGDEQVYRAAASLSGHAVIAGKLSDAELAWLYRNASALIFPSKYEGFGLPPLEAQALGCPVVSSNAASLPEVVGAGGLFFDPDSPASLVAQLDHLESAPAIAADLRDKGLDNVRRYSWQASAAAILKSMTRT